MSMVSIPFKRISNIPFIKVVLENKEQYFVIDSGSAASLLDEKYLNNTINSSEDAETVSVSGIDGTWEGKKAIVWFDIDGVSFRSLFLVSDLGDFFRIPEEKLGPVAGILGGNFLYHYKAVIDYGKECIFIDENNID